MLPRYGLIRSRFVVPDICFSRVQGGGMLALISSAFRLSFCVLDSEYLVTVLVIPLYLVLCTNDRDIKLFMCDNL